MAFATTDDLASFIQGATPPGGSAALALDIASTSVTAAAGVPIVAGTDDDVPVDSDGGPRLLLPKWPVTAVASVTVGGVDPGHWDWSRAGVLIRTGGWHWPVGPRRVVVTYSHGYDTVDIPPVVRDVTLSVAARLLANPQRMQSISGDAGGGVFGIGSNVLVTELTDGERDRVSEAMV